MFPKPSRTARKRQEVKVRRGLERDEDKAKAAVRRRDKACRFPLCGCRQLGLRLEVSHHAHKGMGGNPSGSRNTTRNMVLLCTHRHQDGAISRHHGTLRVRFLTPAGFDGPVAWSVDVGLAQPRWVVVAREDAPGRLEPLTDKQRNYLEVLAEMDRL